MYFARLCCFGSFFAHFNETIFKLPLDVSNLLPTQGVGLKNYSGLLGSVFLKEFCFVVSRFRDSLSTLHLSLIIIPIHECYGQKIDSRKNLALVFLEEILCISDGSFFFDFHFH